MNSEEFLKSLLAKRLRIKIKDGRVIDGNFMCTDDTCNLVISNCEEFLTQTDVDETERNPKFNTANIRTLGLAIVPGQEIVSISVIKEFLSKETLEYISAEKNGDHKTDPDASIENDK